MALAPTFRAYSAGVCASAQSETPGRTERTLAVSGALESILFERLPAYSPQLNPVEFVWSHTKHGKMANFCPLDFAQLGDRVSDTLLETRREQRLLRSFFDHAALTLEFSPLDS